MNERLVIINERVVLGLWECPNCTPERSCDVCRRVAADVAKAIDDMLFSALWKEVQARAKTCPRVNRLYDSGLSTTSN